MFSIVDLKRIKENFIWDYMQMVENKENTPLNINLRLLGPDQTSIGSYTMQVWTIILVEKTFYFKVWHILEPVDLTTWCLLERGVEIEPNSHRLPTSSKSAEWCHRSIHSASKYKVRKRSVGL